ncbi:unnamed protein product [Cuscuta epithymum]|uniref:Protein kinase domain-containing protein n=1 Tax=Cuscuta epithymum TaxID=186058 RepID=A0AAV0ET08_9ASTE|nr:unnamed protein product [Cuscuta epithymum]
MKGYLGLLVFILVYQNLTSGWSLKNEGLGVLRSKEKVISARALYQSEGLKSWKYGLGSSNFRGYFVSQKITKFRRVARRELHKVRFFPFHYPPRQGATAPTPSPSPSPSWSPHGPVPAPPPDSSVLEVARPGPTPVSSVSPASPPSPEEGSFRSNSFRNGNKKRTKLWIVAATVGGSIMLMVSAICVVICQRNKFAVVKPWATGISGPLQKAFVTGVPKLRRSELETACEEFSNVIGSSSVHRLYKGTLSSGVEIAVLSLSVSSAKDWSRDQESLFRQKIEALSKVSHKNFVNLIGYCVEEEPFTRMMVFEYAPNGSLFEHLHIREAEHLDWATRMRIMMGMAYCLEHLHQSTPPLFPNTLNSSSILLSDDYAAKMSDFVLWAGETSNGPNNVYSFGVILFEMLTGRLPYSDNTSALEDWASCYLRGGGGLMADPTLDGFQKDQMERIGEVIRSCVDPHPGHRLGMGEVSSRLREISGIRADGATPKVSPLWWAELEIISTDEAA